MKQVLGLVLVLVMSTALWAQQGEGTNCGFSRVVEDQTCGDACQMTTFYVDETSSEYCLFCQMISCTGYYGWCHATMILTRVSDGANIASCDNQEQESCAGSFPPYQCGLTLIQGVQYKLTVCMQACPGVGSCSDCANCVARAQVCLPQ